MGWAVAGLGREAGERGDREAVGRDAREERARLKPIKEAAMTVGEVAAGTKVAGWGMLEGRQRLMGDILRRKEGRLLQMTFLLKGILVVGEPEVPAALGTPVVEAA